MSTSARPTPTSLIPTHTSVSPRDVQTPARPTRSVGGLARRRNASGHQWYDDLLHVSRNVTPSSAEGITLERWNLMTSRRRTCWSMTCHTPRYRRLVSKPFSRREVAHENAIRLLASPSIALAGGLFDFVDRIAKQLPMRMLGTLLGVPECDGDWLVERGRARQLRPRVHGAPARADRHG